MFFKFCHFSLFEKVAFTTCWVFSFFTFCGFWKNPVFDVFCHFFVTFLFQQSGVKVGDLWKIGSKKVVRKLVKKTCFLKWPKTWNSRFWPTFDDLFVGLLEVTQIWWEILELFTVFLENVKIGVQKVVQKVAKMGHFGRFCHLSWPFLERFGHFCVFVIF